MTMEESTRTPIEMARPASDRMFVSTLTIPSVRRSHIIRNDASTASGNVIAMTSEVRK